MKLLIRNLARTTTEEDLRALFEVYGKPARAGKKSRTGRTQE